MNCSDHKKPYLGSKSLHLEVEVKVVIFKDDIMT
jgi:hypothetical protein